MTNEEAKQAFFARVPVMWQGILYSKISKIIYSLDREGQLIVSAELLDRRSNSVNITRVQDIEGVIECNS